MKRFLFSLLLVFGIVSAQAAYLRNIPRELIQPNGDTLHCFASGDEFYNYLHDAQGYTIVLDVATGYYVYADKVSDQLIPTAIVPGRDNPATAGLVPFLNISPEQRMKKRQERLAQMPQRSNDRSPDMAVNQGTMSNLVVFIRFSGESNLTTSYNTVENMFNNQTSGYNSMYNYFKAASYNKLFINSTFYPAPSGNTILSYQDTYPRSYYQPYSGSNPNGYSNDTESTNREHALLKRAVDHIKNSVPTSLNIDYNNDGYVDNVCFVIKGNVGDWSDLLWPHRWALHSVNATINGKRVWDYNFQLEGASSYFTNAVLCHEMFHTLGAPDLYHYYHGEDLSPVGPWDLMEQNSNPPQHSGAYMKYKYGNWIDDIPTITTPGTYTLNPIGSTTNTQTCYKIPINNSQFYVLEYRKNTQSFETELPGSGLLIYRINTEYNGNAGYDGYYEFDEVYLFRPGGTTTNNGNISQAHFSSNVGRTAFNASTNPYPFLTNGTRDDLKISNITSAGNTIQFTYGDASPGGCDAPTNLTAVSSAFEGKPAIYLKWNAVSAAISYSVYNNEGSKLGETSDLDGYITGVSVGSYYCYTVTANCSSGSSVHSNKACVTVEPLSGCDAPVLVVTPSEYEGEPAFLLTWDAVADATTYSVYQEGYHLKTFSGLGIYITNVEIGVPYCFTVVANCQSGSSPHSNEACATISSGCNPPVGLTATANGNSVNLVWSPPSRGDRTTLLKEGFESGLPQGWTLKEADGDGYNWMSMNTAMSNIPGCPFSGSDYSNSGNDCFVSWSYYPTSYSGDGFGGQALNSNNYLITPSVTVPSTGASLSFYITSLNSSSYPDSYKILISTTGSDVANFTGTLQSLTVASWDQFQKKTLSLNAYAGKTIYIAFVHQSNDQFGLLLDDVEITGEPDGAEYNIYRNGTYLTTVENRTSYTDTPAASGNYCYTVTTVCSDQESAASNEACANTSSSGCDAPVITAHSSVYQGKPSVLLLWTAIPDAMNYSVYTEDGYLLGSVSTTSVHISGVDFNATYCYTVVANCSDGASPHSNKACATITSGCNTPYLTASPAEYEGKAVVLLEWTPIYGATKYSIYKDGTTFVDETDGTGVYMLNLTAGEHCYTIVADCSSGTSNHSNMACATIESQFKCELPTNLQATATARNVALSWNAAPDATGYEVYRNGALVTTTSSTNYADNNLKCKTQYCYKIKTICPAGTSDFTQEVCCTTENIPVYHSFSAEACGSYKWNTTTYSNSGTYEQTLSSNGCDSIVTLTLIIHPEYKIPLTADICYGESYTENGFNIQTPLAGTKEYTRTVPTVAHKCDSTLVLTLTVHALPKVTISGKTEIEPGGSTVLTASGALHYEWSTGETTESITVSPLATTTYSVSGTDSYDCQGETSATVLVLNNIADADSDKYRIYPNPANTFFVIEGAPIRRVELFNTLGQFISSKDFDESESVQIDTNELESGLYLLKIYDRTHNASSKRIIIQR